MAACGRPRASHGTVPDRRPDQDDRDGSPGRPSATTGRPQDIEWAVDRDLPEGENVILLQARPETVLEQEGRRRRRRRPPAGDFMSSIVSTLMSPLNAKKN